MNQITPTISLVNGVTVSYKSDVYKKLQVSVYNPWTDKTYIKKVRAGKRPFKVDIHYMAPWIIKFTHKGKTVFETQLSYENCQVVIMFATEALGDTLAWVPCIEEWVRKNNPSKLYLITKWNNIFDRSKMDSRIIFKENLDEVRAENPHISVMYHVGIPRDFNKALDLSKNHANSVVWVETNMIHTMNFSLGLDIKERKPNLVELSDERPNFKYVTLCTTSSQRLKTVLNPMLWVVLIANLKAMGLEVVVVGNKPNILPDTIDGTGDDITKAMKLIRDAEFHIGLSSGLSWMAWAYNKYVLMIGNFTHQGYEFQDKLTRVMNVHGNHSVFNNINIPWVPRESWDPFNDDLEMARNISPEMAVWGLQHLLFKKDNNDSIGTFLGSNGFEVIHPLIPKEIPRGYQRVENPIR